MCSCRFSCSGGSSQEKGIISKRLNPICSRECCYSTISYNMTPTKLDWPWKLLWIVGWFKVQAKSFVHNREPLCVRVDLTGPRLWICIQWLHIFTTVPKYLHNTLSYFETMYISTGLAAAARYIHSPLFLPHISFTHPLHICFLFSSPIFCLLLKSSFTLITLCF